jgi:hypothetical protein
VGHREGVRLSEAAFGVIAQGYRLALPHRSNI